MTLLEEAEKPAAVLRAEALGHTVTWDPPAALTATLRWTCKPCGAAVLDHQGTIYGSAVERHCLYPAGRLS